MKLLADERLATVCRAVEERLRGIAELELRVVLLADFDATFPENRLQPALYCHSERTIYVNDATFGGCIPEAVLAHEIAHAAQRHGLLTDERYQVLTPELLPDVVASDWSFREDIKRDRVSLGPLYCEILDPSLDKLQLSQRVQKYFAFGKTPPTPPRT